MKTISPYFHCCLFVLFTLSCKAQLTGSFDEWGKVTLDDLKIATCTFNKDADALKLMDYGDIYYDKKLQLMHPYLTSKGRYAYWSTPTRFHIIESHYRRVKVLNENGAKNANFKFFYYAGSDEDIYDIKAICYNLDSDGTIKTTELKASEIYRSEAENHSSQVAFSVPGVKAGSVFEVTYKLKKNVTYNLPGWSFSGTEPCLKSRLRIDFIDAYLYYADEHFNRKKCTKTSKDYISEIILAGSNGRPIPGTETVYTETNIPSKAEEPFQTSMHNDAERVDFQLRAFGPQFGIVKPLINSYSDYNNYLLDNDEFLSCLNVWGIPQNEVDEAIKNATTDAGKARAIFELVQKSMQWDGSFATMPRNTNGKTWKNKTGSSAEINLLLISALRMAGLKAHAALAPSRATGYPNISYPMLHQFKTLIASVDVGTDQTLLLDATDKYLPFGYIDQDILDNFVFVLQETSASEWRSTFDEASNSNSVSIRATLGADGLINGKMRIDYEDYDAIAFRRLKAANKEDDISTYTKKQLPGINIQSLNDTADDVHNTFQAKVDFSKQAIADNDGNLYITLGDVYGSGINPFLNENRTSDVSFGYKQKLSVSYYLTIPDNYSIDSLFPTVAFIMPDTSIKVILKADLSGNTLLIREKIEYKKSLYKLDDYPALYEFHKKYFKFIEQAIMLKKKK